MTKAYGKHMLLFEFPDTQGDQQTCREFQE